MEVVEERKEGDNKIEGQAMTKREVAASMVNSTSTFMTAQGTKALQVAAMT